MSSAASGSRSFEVACVVGVVSWDGRGIGKGHVCDVECGAGVLAVFVAGAGADRLEGVARRVPDDGPGKCAVGLEGSVGGSGAADSREQAQAAPDTPTHHPHVPPSSLTRPGLASIVNEPASPSGPSIISTFPTTSRTPHI